MSRARDEGEGVVRQLPLALEHPPRFGAEDFLVSPENAAGYRLVTAWPQWPGRAVLLVGPAGSGKTHLSSIWAALSGASLVAGAELGPEALAGFEEGGKLALDDIESAREDRLFHLLNLVRERQGSLLLSSSGFRAGWPALADLASRLRALPREELGPPEEPLVRAVLVKLLHDRQLSVDASLVDYLARRIDRSLGVARDVVAELDREALSQGRRVTRAMAATVLGRFATDEP